MPDEQEGLENLPITSHIESILFVAPEPVPIPLISQTLEVPNQEVENALGVLAESYIGRGLQIQRIGDRVHLTTSPHSARIVERFLGMEHTTGLSRAALETLAILAYRQPLTRPQVDAIRGVNSDSVLDSLMAKGLVEELGRADTPGRPIVYGTTPAFLQHFGLGSISELPSLEMKEPETDGQAEAVKEHAAISTLKG